MRLFSQFVRDSIIKKDVNTFDITVGKQRQARTWTCSVHLFPARLDLGRQRANDSREALMTRQRSTRLLVRVPKSCVAQDVEFAAGIVDQPRVLNATLLSRPDTPLDDAGLRVPFPLLLKLRRRRVVEQQRCLLALHQRDHVWVLCGAARDSRSTHPNNQRIRAIGHLHMTRAEIESK